MEDPTLQLKADELLFLNSYECPFAQRVLIGLQEKAVPYRQAEINLRDESGQYAPHLKTDWDLRLNPEGKVPMLAYEEEHTIHQIYDSNICLEFLEDFQPAPSLLPPHPAIRARARQEPAAQQAAAGALSEHLHWLEGRFDSAGPYIMGKEFSLVDASLLPFFLRLPVLQHYRGFSLPADCPRLAAWVSEASQRRSVRASCVSPVPNLAYDKDLLWV